MTSVDFVCDCHSTEDGDCARILSEMSDRTDEEQGPRGVPTRGERFVTSGTEVNSDWQGGIAGQVIKRICRGYLSFHGLVYIKEG